MKNRIIVIFTFVTGLFLLNSCLKDTNDYWPDDVAGKMYATVFKPALQTLPLSPVPDTVDFSFMVNIATDQPPTSDVTLTLAVDPTAVTAYNARTGKSYLAYPKVRLVTPTVTIPAGTRVGTVRAKVWGANELDACANFIAAVTIKSVSDPNIMIPSNMKSYLLALPISNPYAGTYQVVGYRKHPSLGFFDVNKEETATTVDCKTIIKSGFGDYPYDVKIEITADPITVAGRENCVKCNLTILDPSTTLKVDGSGQYATFTGDNTHVPIPLTNDVNFYDKDKKVFVLNAFYNSAANRIMYEVMSRKVVGK